MMHGQQNVKSTKQVNTLGIHLRLICEVSYLNDDLSNAKFIERTVNR